MIWEDQLVDASNALDMSPAMAGTFISLVATICLILGVLIATRGSQAQYTVPISALLSMIMFTMFQNIKNVPESFTNRREYGSTYIIKIVHTRGYNVKSLAFSI